MPTLMWYGFLLPAYLYHIRKKSFFNACIAVFILLVVSGRIPAPALPNGLELWMIYATFIGPFLFLSNLRRQAKMTKYNSRGRSLIYFLGLVFNILVIAFGCISYATIRDYNQGYFILLLACQAVVLALLTFPENDKYSLKRDICSCLVVAVSSICTLALVLQILIFCGLAACPNFYPYHPEGDIHCVTTPIGDIYRLSIGSNINEFSMYILCSFLLLLDKRSTTEAPKRVHVYIPFSSRSFSVIFPTRKPILIFLLICGFLALSRALMLGLCLFLFIALCRSVLNISLGGPLKEHMLNRIFKVSRSHIKFLIFGLALLILLIPFLASSEFTELFSSRFSFLWDFQSILEGSSSQERIHQFNDYLPVLEKLSIMPVLALGEGTILHNTFIQLLLEYGSIVAIIGLLILVYALLFSPLLVAPLLVYLLSHHVLYNPFLWIYLFAVTTRNVAQAHPVVTTLDNKLLSTGNAGMQQAALKIMISPSFKEKPC